MAGLHGFVEDGDDPLPDGKDVKANVPLGGLAETQGRIISLLERVLPALNVLEPDQEGEAAEAQIELKRLQDEIDGLRLQLDTSRSEFARLTEALDLERLSAQEWREKSEKALEAAKIADTEAEKFAASQAAAMTALELLREETAGLRAELQNAVAQVERLERERERAVDQMTGSGDGAAPVERGFREKIAFLEATLREREEQVEALRQDAGRALREERASLEALLAERDGKLESLRLEGQRAAGLHADEKASLEQRLASAEETQEALREELENAHAPSETGPQTFLEPSRGCSGGTFWKFSTAILLAGLALAVVALVRDGRRQKNASISSMSQAPDNAGGYGGELPAALDALRQEVARLGDKSTSLDDKSNELMRALLTRLGSPQNDSAGLQPREDSSSLERMSGRLVSVPFGAGEDMLSSAQTKEMEPVLKRILAVPRVAVLVVGYADEQPLRGELKKRYVDNTALSRARALSVARALVAGGVPEGLVTTCGMGTAKLLPVAGGAQDMGAQRRVDILCW